MNMVSTWTRWLDLSSAAPMVNWNLWVAEANFLLTEQSFTILDRDVNMFLLVFSFVALCDISSKSRTEGCSSVWWSVLSSDFVYRTKRMSSGYDFCIRRSLSILSMCRLSPRLTKHSWIKMCNSMPTIYFMENKVGISSAINIDSTSDIKSNRVNGICIVTDPLHLLVASIPFTMRLSELLILAGS